jgi:hypothetical protein
MPIEFNLFKPAYDNILVPLANSLVLPYTDLMKDTIKPLYHSFTARGQSYQDGVQKFNSMLKTIELIAQVSVFFFIYQKGWDLGMRYFGLALGPIASGFLCAAVYGAGCTLDNYLNTRITNICTGTWLYYKGGTTLLRSLGTYREGLLAALLLNVCLGFKHQKASSQTENSWDINRRKAAEWLASSFGYQKPPSTSQSPGGNKSIDSV